MSSLSQNGSDAPTPRAKDQKVKWYRSTFYNIFILGLCNFAAPGIWGAMNSLGAGGAQKPYLVNTANALTFCLMVVSCWLSSALVHYIGIKGALIFGTLGYAPYAAGLYTNNRFGTEWLTILGAALCGISAGVFWMAEAAIAIAYPEPWNRGKALGFWLTFRVGGQILGGAINLGLNTDRDQAGKVSYTVFLIFIALQCLGPFVALGLTPPEKVERRDGKKVDLAILNNPWFEIKQTTRLFFTTKFLLIVLFIGQAVFSEAYWLDRTKVSLKLRARSSFWAIVSFQGGCWIWATVLVTRYHRTRPTYDWSSEDFGSGFAVFVFLLLGFQLNYLFLYFVIQNLSESKEEIIRYAALLRGTESAWQAVSYGLESIPIMAHVGGVYMNFALWGVAIIPAWLVLRHFGATEPADERRHVPSDSPLGDSGTDTTDEMQKTV
ncbi:putative membrane protein C6F6.04c [Purpureocillium lavendulum]|uniref:Membrane protein C6F6.04c n=1 Tax=Purpureocillium lavendulum TaxID=1247861 RepID=A0AB34FFB5_9HYPO|nr:putative membrane protein C6F6.04c [Purpureocillium lavendulum]